MEFLYPFVTIYTYRIYINTYEFCFTVETY